MKKYIGFIAFIGLTLGYIWGIGLFAPKIEPPTEGIPHNYWHPEVFNYDTFIVDTVDVIEEDGVRWYTLDTILLAIMFVESSYNDSAYVASEDAVGCLQIRKCMVDDVNRILRRQKSDLRFSYDDRWLRDKSIKIFDIYCKHYGLTTAEQIARCWNGGPRGMQNEMTAGYWKKVKNQLDS